MRIVRSANAVGAAVLMTLVVSGPRADTGEIDIRLDTDEPDAVLTILARQDAGHPVPDGDWDILFATEGYVRLKAREAAMSRSFTDDDFVAFVRADSMGERVTSLRATLDAWRAIDVEAAARRALVYLPEDSRIRATIYPVIKPRSNSFVFEISTDPAIFLYLDPSVSPEKFENTLVHELHHIGFGSTCPSEEVDLGIAGEPEGAQEALRWLGAFGEGFAMLTAAGDPHVHPHAVSDPKERARWDGDMRNAESDLQRVEAFLLATLDDALTEDEIRQTAYSFYGVQGPWYTVGWLMAVAIEEVFGREVLISCFCDPRQLLGTYNAAAGEHHRGGGDPLPVWSDAVVSRLGGQAPLTGVGSGK